MKKILIILNACLFIVSCAITQEPSAVDMPIVMNNPQFDAAVKEIKANPKNPNGYAARAQIYADNQILTSAQQDFITALKIAPSDISINKSYADFLCNKKHDMYSASLFYNRLVEIESDTYKKANIYSDYANCASSSGQFDIALNLYGKALDGDNPPLSAYKGIVSLYDQQENYAVANYYAGLYHGTPTQESLSMQIRQLTKLIHSNPKINNIAELKQRLAKLEQQYDAMISKPRQN